MPVPISVVLGLPTEQESIADVGAQVCSNLHITGGLSPIPWNAVFKNVAEGCPVDCDCVPEKAEGEQESEEEVEEVGATPENAMYRTPKQSRGPGKRGGRTRKGDENKDSSSQSKGKGNKRAQASHPDESAAAGTDSQSVVCFQEGQDWVSGMEGMIQLLQNELNGLCCSCCWLHTVVISLPSDHDIYS